MIEPGQKAPDFALKTQEGKTVSLSNSKGIIALYFYPKDDTPGCTKQACSLRDGIRLLQKSGITILGVSGDSAQSHSEFIKKYSLPFDLLVDEENKVAKKYGAYGEKNMYGKKYMDVLRTTFIIKDGIVQHVFKNVDVDNHAKQILESLQ